MVKWASRVGALLRALAFLIVYSLLFVPQAVIGLWPLGAHLAYGWWSPLGALGVWAIWMVPFGYCMYRLYGSAWWNSLHDYLLRRVVSSARDL